MRKRINTDLFLDLNIKKKDGTNEDLSLAYDMVLTVRHAIYSNVHSAQLFKVNGNVVSFQYSAEENVKLGLHNASFLYKKESANSETGFIQYACDFDNAFEIVPSSSQEDSTNTLMGEAIHYGADGATAFELWKLEQGDVNLTMEDYFTWLRQPAKEAGDKLLTETSFQVKDGKLYVTINN